MRKLITIISGVIVAWSLSVASQASAVLVNFELAGNSVAVPRSVPAGMSRVEAAAAALVNGPTAAEAAAGYTSVIPAGVTIVKMGVTGSELTVDLSPDIIPHLDEHTLKDIAGAFFNTIGEFPEVSDIRLTSKGKLLASYLPAAPVVGGPPVSLQADEVQLAGLAGRKVTIGPSHGRYYTGSFWGWQRSDPCGLGEAVLEDTNSIRLMQFLNQYLAQDGANVTVPRTLDETICCNAPTGLHWWKMAARYWLQNQGLPSSVWDSSTSDLNDDIRARPLYADYVGSDIYIAHHTNAFDGSVSGTEIYYDLAMDNPQHEANSQNLAIKVKTNVDAAIRDMYDNTWNIRNSGNPRNANGAYGEIRIPNRPAILVELAFHDNCSKDAIYLTDNYFRSVTQWAIYKSICEYFNTAPTWDKYSCEYVSDTIPTTMSPGQSYNVSVTYRNRGVLWVNSRNFRLGAVGDSDPFTATTRHNIAGEVRPGNTYTFNFTLTAPASPGNYVSDWRMVRDGVAWFGPTVTKNINVQVTDSQPPTIPTGLNGVANSPIQVQLSWNASSDNIGVTGYDIRRNGNIIGSSATTSYMDNTVAPGGNYTYEVRAKDAAGNTSAFSSPAIVNTPADTQPPTTPSNLTANYQGGGVQLSWGASTDNVGPVTYELRRNGNVIQTLSGTSYSDLLVNVATSYTYDVRARDAVPNYSDWSNQQTVITPVEPVGVFADGFDGNLNNWIQAASAFDYSAAQNRGLYQGAGAAYCAAGQSDQMYRLFSRPFAQGKVSGYWYDPNGGFKSGVCGVGFRQALSLRAAEGTGVGMIIDNCTAQNIGNANYYWRTVGSGGQTYTSYAVRNPNTNCSGAWINFETEVNPGNIGASPTGSFTVKVTDGAGQTSFTGNLTNDFFTYGIGRITLGLGVSSVGESWWDDISFVASPPNPPVLGIGSVTQNSVNWTLAPGDNNHFGFEVTDSSGNPVSPVYPNAGWLTRSATSWNETGLAANTTISRRLRSWNGTLDSALVAAVSATTLSVQPSGATVVSNRNSSQVYGTLSGNQFTAVGGFGTGTVQYYRYAFNQSAVYSFNDSEAVWNSGVLDLSAASSGAWYFHVKGYNSANVANGTFTIGPIVLSDAPAVTPIGSAWALADGASVTIKDKVVTASFAGWFTIQELDRSAAIKVVSASVVNSGDIVDVTGELGLSGAQRALLSAYAAVKSSANPLPEALGMMNRAIGGQAFNANTPGVTGAVSLYNIGILTSAWGIVTAGDSSNPSQQYFYINDGSNLDDGSGNIGLRIYTGPTTPPTIGTVIGVTGVSGSETSASGVSPVMFIRGASDISVL